MPAPRKYEWEKIKSEYVYGDDTTNLTGLASKHNLPYRTLYKRYSTDGWEIERDEYRKEKQTEVRKKLIDKHSENVLKYADILHILNTSIAKEIGDKIEKKQKLTPDEVEQFSRIIGGNAKRVKMIIGEYTDIVKVDDDSTLRKIINQAEREKEEGITGEDEDKNIDLNQAGKSYGPEDKKKSKGGK